MMNITPLLTASQANQPSPAPAGTTQGSDSIFGKIFGQAVAADRQQGDKVAPPKSPVASQEEPSAENEQYLVEQNKTDILSGVLSEIISMPSPRETTLDRFSAQGNTILNDQALLENINNHFAVKQEGSETATEEAEIPDLTSIQEKSLQYSEIIPGIPATDSERKTFFTENPTPITTRGQAAAISSIDNTSDQNNAPLSSPIRDLWPSGVSLSANESISLSGYFTAQKSQPLSLLQVNATSTDNHLSSAVDRPEGIQQKYVPALVPGLAHLAAIAEKYSLAMTSNVQATNTTIQQETIETAPLMVSLNQLTSLKLPGADTQENYRPLDTEPLRQQFQEQITQLKTETKNNDTSEQQFATKKESATAAFMQGASSSATGSIDQPLTFAESGQNMMSPVHGSNAPINSQPVSPLPQLSPIIHDHAVLQQVAERFQLQMQNQETRLKIQLQPAELGKLDINLTVKEGYIRAHVVTQSGQVQELLERNMTRLRGILESQGFTIEDIRVSTASDSIDNSDLFQEQLAQHHQQAENESHNSDTRFGETLNNFITAGTEQVTGVNITA